MAVYGPGVFLYMVLITLGWIMTIYTLNFYYLAYIARKKNKHSAAKQPAVLPAVTVQLPLYNEKYVARRLIDAVCKLDYPKDKLQIQVLDDSDDDTVDLIQSIVQEYRLKGFDIEQLRRNSRAGYKAGALKEGMKSAKGEFITIFDADFVPPAWFLKRLIGHFEDPKMGFVQCKWGHINENYSAMTEAEAVSLDIHFLVEQKAKSGSHFFLNFNGTAGVWRKSCIDDSGGWHTSTLVEDMDLSFRAHMRGWKSLLLNDLVVDAELPVQINAAKRQQFRWAKGSIQVALKLMGDVALHRKVPVETKAQAFIQMTRHIVNPLFLAQFLILPVLLGMDFTLYDEKWGPLAVWTTYFAFGPGGYLFVINRTWKGSWRGKAKQFFYLMFFSAGLTVNNSVAVFDALFGRKNEFLRTPKFGIVKRGEDWRANEYALPFTKTTLLEIFFAIYGIIGMFTAIFSGNMLYAPLMIIPTIGFIYVAYLSFAHSRLGKKKPKHAKQTFQVKRGIVARMLLPGVLAFLVLGSCLAWYGYYVTIYPIQEASGFLARAQSSQTPQQLSEYIALAKKTLPESGNPAWIFQTPRTDFGQINAQLDEMISRSERMSLQEPHTEDYNSAMTDMHAAIEIVQDNINEAIPFIYVSPTNLALSVAWVAVILGVFAAVRKARTRQERTATATALQGR